MTMIAARHIVPRARIRQRSINGLPDRAFAKPSRWADFDTNLAYRNGIRQRRADLGLTAHHRISNVHASVTLDGLPALILSFGNWPREISVSLTPDYVLDVTERSIAEAMSDWGNQRQQVFGGWFFLGGTYRLAEQRAQERVA